MKQSKKWLFILPCLLLLMFACSFPTVQDSQQSRVDENYPATPEGVVKEFLINYEENEANLSSYLTKSQTSEDAVEMLQMNGMLMSFMIRSASVIPEPPTAIIEVQISLSGEEVGRIFHLIQEKGQWKIDSIELITD